MSVFCGCEMWILTREEEELCMFEKEVFTKSTGVRT